MTTMMTSTLLMITAMASVADDDYCADGGDAMLT
jgi:hypothetical protein